MCSSKIHHQMALFIQLLQDSKAQALSPGPGEPAPYPLYFHVFPALVHPKNCYSGESMNEKHLNVQDKEYSMTRAWEALLQCNISGATGTSGPPVPSVLISGYCGDFNNLLVSSMLSSLYFTSRKHADLRSRICP